MVAFKFILLVVSVLVGYTLGWHFTERYVLAEKHPLFRFKAFECRKCLSFHIAWVTSTIVSLMFVDWVMLAVGIAFAFVLFVGLYVDERNKTVKIEDETNEME